VRHEPPVEYNVTVLGLLPPTAGVALLASGEPAGRFDPSHAYVTATLPGEVHLFSTPEALALRFDTTCEPVVVPLPREFDTDLAERQARSDGRIGGVIHVNYYTSLPTGLPPMVRLWLDNRGGAQTVLHVGAASVNVEADAARAELIAIGTCAGGRSVRLGDTVLGELPPGAEPISEFIVSVAGDHCYRNVGRMYAGAFADAQGASAPETYSGARVLATRPVAFFLERAPDSIDGSPFARPETASYELFEVERTRCR
jgi:hypothetical protein